MRLIALTFFLTLLAGMAAAEARFALIIGNDSYADVGRLTNARNDAQLMQQALTAQGFEVRVLTDATRDQMLAAVEDLARRAPGLDAAAFYFAGHGLQKDGENYLVPVDARLRSELAIPSETLAVDTVLRAMEAARVSLVFLDACRNNPLAEALHQSAVAAGRVITVNEGLAVVRPRGDSLVAFATLPNAVASDGEGRNSPFARALARHVGTPDIEVSIMLRRVTADVLAETDGEQRPQQITQMQGEFYFARTGGATERPELPAMLTVYPDRATRGQEIALVADLPAGCLPFFFHLAPSNRMTPLPLDYFRQTRLGAGQMRFEISPGSRFGLVVTPEDEPGLNRLGYICEDAGLAGQDQVIAALRAVSQALAEGRDEGVLDPAGLPPVRFQTRGFTVH